MIEDNFPCRLFREYIMDHPRSGAAQLWRRHGSACYVALGGFAKALWTGNFAREDFIHWYNALSQAEGRKQIIAMMCRWG